MRCPRCGTENLKETRTCRRCGRALPGPQSNGPKVRPPPAARQQTSPPKTAMGAAAVEAPERTLSPQEISQKVKMDYLLARKDLTHKALEGVQSLLQHMNRQKFVLHDLLQEAASLIWRLFWIKEVTIGVRNPLDGQYKYEVMVGLRDDIWLAHKRLSYELEDFFESSTYRGTMISKHTKVLLAEENPYSEGEENTYIKHAMQESRRRYTDDSIEGDYLDMHIFGPNDEFLGWIEISGTKTGKLPDAATIKWIETIGFVLGVAISSSVFGRVGRRYQSAPALLSDKP